MGNHSKDEGPHHGPVPRVSAGDLESRVSGNEGTVVPRPGFPGPRRCSHKAAVTVATKGAASKLKDEVNYERVPTEVRTPL